MLIQMPMTFGLDYHMSFLIDPLAFDLDLSPAHSLYHSQSHFVSMQKDHIIPCLKQYIIQNPIYVFLLRFAVHKAGDLVGFASLCFIGNVHSTSYIVLYKYQLVE